MHIHLYGNRESGHSYKVALALRLINLPFTLESVDMELPREKRSEGFRKHARFSEIPALTIDGESLVQSNVILDVLARRTGKLDGKDEREKQRVREWMAWEANRIGFSMPNLRWSRGFVPQGAQVEQWLEARTLRDLDVLNQSLTKTVYLIGSHLTIADISCCAYLYWPNQAGIDLGPYPHLRRWLDAIARQPNWIDPYELYDALRLARAPNPAPAA